MTLTGGRRAGRDNLVEGLLQACRTDPVLSGPRPSNVVVALSGGPDSSALLHALARASAALRINLQAVHVDHGLRAASATDAVRAGQFAAELQVPLRHFSLTPRARGEDAARRARYRALEQAAADLAADTIALGHTATDQAETVLLHLVRGAGLEGIAAMAPREGLRFRPLLDVTRQQVLAYCRRHRLQTTHDESNDDPAYTRNRVRNQLIPLLERDYNPRVTAALNRLARAARDEHSVVESAAVAWLDAHRGLPRDEFLALPVGLQAHVLRQAWASAAGRQSPAGTAARIDQALRLVRGERPGMIHLGAGFELHVDAGTVWFRPARVLTRP